MNKSEMVYDHTLLMADFMDCECFKIDENEDLSDYDKSIEEINGMISWYVAEGNEEEISFWRKMLQQVKVEKRRAKKMIDNSRMEVAYT